MESFEDRRQYTRVTANAYSCGKICVLDFGGSRRQAELVDISAGGARLKLQVDLVEPQNTELVLSVTTVDYRGILQGLRAKIRWKNGQEIGVKFQEELDVGISDLQRIVC